MIRRSTWVVLGIFGLVLIGAVLWTRLRPSADVAGTTDLTPTVAPLWSVTAPEIRSLRIEDLANGAVVELRRGDENTPWLMVQPTQTPADGGRVEWAVNALLEPRPRAVLPAPADLTPYGLAKPLTRITLFLQGDVSRSILVGRLTPTGGDYYVQVPGVSGILLLSEYSLTDVLNLVADLPFPATATPPPEGMGATGTPVASPTSIPGTGTPSPTP